MDISGTVLLPVTGWPVSSNLSATTSPSDSTPNTTTLLPGTMTIARSRGSGPSWANSGPGGTWDSGAAVGGVVPEAGGATSGEPGVVVDDEPLAAMVVEVVVANVTVVEVVVAPAAAVEVVVAPGRVVVVVAAPGTVVVLPLGEVVVTVDVVDESAVVVVGAVVVVVSSGGASISWTTHPPSRTAAPPGQFRPG